ncbi:MAG: hypothetical protein S4CHLAM7_04590 [Chlamydiae bacterium]|nr:hypothetical protein [Chlamydiota bacterium]
MERLKILQFHFQLSNYLKTIRVPLFEMSCNKLFSKNKKDYYNSKKIESRQLNHFEVV